MDEDGNYFVCFPLTEIMERFNCGHDKASAILNELEQHGLIARSLKGRGRPYRIVVKPFATEPKKQASQLLEKGSDDCGKTDRNKNKENHSNTLEKTNFVFWCVVTNCRVEHNAKESVTGKKRNCSNTKCTKSKFIKCISIFRNKQSPEG